MVTYSDLVGTLASLACLQSLAALTLDPSAVPTLPLGLRRRFARPLHRRSLSRRKVIEDLTTKV